VKKAVLDWLSKNQTVNATNIHENYDIGRHTAGKYLKKMYDHGLLAQKSKTIYMLPKSQS